MSKRMTPGELARRKKIQADLSIAGGTLGLTALGAKGASSVLRSAGKFSAAKKVEKPVVGLLTGGAGIGGVGAFNFAATQRAEAAGVRPKMNNVKKSFHLVAVSKAYNPEKNRMRRADIYTGSALAGSAGSAYISGKRFVGAGGSGHIRQAKQAFILSRSEYNKSKTRTGRTAQANITNDIKRAKALKEASIKHVYSAGRIARSKAVLVPVVASAGLSGVAGAIQSQKRNSGRSYSGWYDQKKKPKFSRVDNTTATSN